MERAIPELEKFSSESKLLVVHDLLGVCGISKKYTLALMCA